MAVHEMMKNCLAVRRRFVFEHNLSLPDVSRLRCAWRASRGFVLPEHWCDPTLQQGCWLHQEHLSPQHFQTPLFGSHLRSVEDAQVGCSIPALLLPSCTGQQALPGCASSGAAGVLCWGKKKDGFPFGG